MKNYAFDNSEINKQILNGFRFIKQKNENESSRLLDLFNRIRQMSIIASIISIAAFLFVGCSDTSKKNENVSFKSGDIAYIGSDSERMFIANDEAGLIRLATAVSSKSEGLMKQLILDGKIFAINRKTKVRVISYGENPFTREVEILDGNLQGRFAWVASDSLKKN